jgi:hypothetical protein
MHTRVILTVVLTGTLLLTTSVSSEEPSAVSKYTLSEILTLALERNPRFTEAEATVTEQEGERVAAGDYPNPSILPRV